MSAPDRVGRLSGAVSAGRTFDVFGAHRMGVLLHVSSLPGPFGIGDLGPQARRFVDWLVAAGVTVWQVLPICPPGGPREDIPYGSWAALAGNPQLLSVEDLVEDGLLEPTEVGSAAGFEEGWAYPMEAAAAKETALNRAVQRLMRDHPLSSALSRFRAEERWALETARFAARWKHCPKPWSQWPTSLVSRAPADLARTDAHLADAIDGWVARLFLFERQWARLRTYANRRGVALLGDVPIYVPTDSADVWAEPTGWQLDEHGRPLVITGAPPDAFASEGQLWPVPVYDWEQMAKDDYAWWRLRLRRAFVHFDAVRLDHFRAFSAYWEVPATARTARDGRWVQGPGRSLFAALERDLGPRPLCAEDLGTIDDDVRSLLADTGLPGMKILQFAFGGGPDNPYLPHNIPAHAVVYPANHDNNTSVGWWRSLGDDVRSHVQHYLGRHGDDIAWDLNRSALASPARLAVLQMQDLLSLDGWARMNDPESYRRPVAEWRNWRWRLKPGEASEAVAERLRFLGGLYGRVPS